MLSVTRPLGYFWGNAKSTSSKTYFINPPVPHQYWCETTPPFPKEDKKIDSGHNPAPFHDAGQVSPE